MGGRCLKANIFNMKCVHDDDDDDDDDDDGDDDDDDDDDQNVWEDDTLR